MTAPELFHAIDRLAHDHIVARLGGRILGVRAAITPVSARALNKLPAPAREAHRRYLLAVGESGESRQLEQGLFLPGVVPVADTHAT